MQDRVLSHMKVLCDVVRMVDIYSAAFLDVRWRAVGLQWARSVISCAPLWSSQSGRHWESKRHDGVFSSS